MHHSSGSERTNVWREVTTPARVSATNKRPAARQHSLPDAEIDGAAGSWRLCVLAGWQAHGKNRALARLALHRHIATHHARELAREGKAEPRAAIAACGQGIGLGEILKQFRLLLRGHADAGIRHGKL